MLTCIPYLEKSLIYVYISFEGKECHEIDYLLTIKCRGLINVIPC